MFVFLSLSAVRGLASRILPAAKRLALLALGMGAAVPPASALDIFHLDPEINLRFSSGNYAEGHLVENPHFLLAAYDLSGLGWAPGGSGVTLISPRHFVTASHMSPLANDTVSFLSRDGVIRHYVVESVFYVEHTPGVRTDLAVGRLTAPIPPEDHVGYFPTLRLPLNSEYVGLQVYSFGYHQACGLNKITRCGIYDVLPFGQPDNVADNVLFITEWHAVPGQAQAQGNDSGSPTFVVYHGKLALIGTHSAVNVTQMPYLTVDVLVPGYFTQIKAHLAKDGYEFGNAAAAAPTGNSTPPAR